MDLEERIAAIEARQRDYRMHDPSCPTRQVERWQEGTDMLLTKQKCECWLNE